MVTSGQLSPFRNEPPIDWSEEENRSRMRKALEKVRGELGKSYPLIIGGQESWTEKTIKSVNPASFSEIVGAVAKADSTLADRAVEAALKSWKHWSKVSPEKRAEYLFKAAEIMRKRRFELSAWLVLEIGKNWREADADVAEAMDFLEYYGRQILHLGKPQLTEVQVPGEINESYYSPRGTGGVLGIWNFACAINTGMVAASVVTGNAVVFKPASVSPVMGYKITEIFQEAGLPPGVLNYLPGSGEEVGEYLVKHPDINFIVLTGSREAGERIDRLAAEYPHREGSKTRILETGGKNGIIYDSDADMDEAIKGTIISWLGYQNQKCSAQSRAILLEHIHDHFVERLIEATQSINIGPPEDPGNFMGPLISEEALRKVQKYVQTGKQEGKIAHEGDVSAELRERGYYHGPVIFTEVHPDARIAQEEIFGPVLAVIKAKTFEEALEIANSTGYALTGGVYSRNPAHIEKAKREFEVGNLYINRAITGSVVGRQPFGGFKGSGTGPKAGGPNYLAKFMIEKTVTENTMRRGFAPWRKAET